MKGLGKLFNKSSSNAQASSSNSSSTALPPSASTSSNPKDDAHASSSSTAGSSSVRSSGANTPLSSVPTSLAGSDILPSPAAIEASGPALVKAVGASAAAAAAAAADNNNSKGKQRDGEEASSSSRESNIAALRSVLLGSKSDGTRGAASRTNSSSSNSNRFRPTSSGSGSNSTYSGANLRVTSSNHRIVANDEDDGDDLRGRGGGGPGGVTSAPNSRRNSISSNRTATTGNTARGHGAGSGGHGGSSSNGHTHSHGHHGHGHSYAHAHGHGHHPASGEADPDAWKKDVMGGAFDPLADAAALQSKEGGETANLNGAFEASSIGGGSVSTRTSTSSSSRSKGKGRATAEEYEEVDAKKGGEEARKPRNVSFGAADSHREPPNEKDYADYGEDYDDDDDDGVERLEFYHQAAPYFWLSNSSDHPVVLDGVKYPTAEHLFQACKFPHRPDLAQRIRKAPNPNAALRLARTHVQQVRSGWIRDGINVQVMNQVLLLKFTQHSVLRDQLLRTGTAQLIEAAPNEVFWGSGLAVGQGSLTGNYRGRNEKGKALMRTRETLRGAAGLGWGSAAVTV